MKVLINNIALENTDSVIKELLFLLPQYKVIVFEGTMGSGKTTLIKNLCKWLGVKELVSSPTFSIVNEYRANNNQTIYHFDFYRLNSLEEALDIGTEEYLHSGALCLIEWPEKVQELLPQAYLNVSISYESNSRNYLIEEIK